MKATCLLKSTIKLTTEWHRMTSPVVGGPPMERVCTGWRDDVTVAADDDNGVMIIQISMQTHTWGGYQNMSGGQIGTCSATDHRPKGEGSVPCTSSLSQREFYVSMIMKEMKAVAGRGGFWDSQTTDQTNSLSLRCAVVRYESVKAFSRIASTTYFQHNFWDIIVNSVRASYMEQRFLN